MSDEPPRMEDATEADLLLAMTACGSRAAYGGFVRVALAAIYAERRAAVEQDTGVYARFFYQDEDANEYGPFDSAEDAVHAACPTP